MGAIADSMKQLIFSTAPFCRSLVTRAVVTRHAGERLGVHAAGEGVDSEGVPQIVDADIGQARPLEQRVHVVAGPAGIDGHRVGEDPPTDGIRLVPPQDVGHAPGQMVRIPCR